LDTKDIKVVDLYVKIAEMGAHLERLEDLYNRLSSDIRGSDGKGSMLTRQALIEVSVKNLKKEFEKFKENVLGTQAKRAQRTMAFIIAGLGAIAALAAAFIQGVLS
jgi:hypothetical protein